MPHSGRASPHDHTCERHLRTASRPSEPHSTFDTSGTASFPRPISGGARFVYSKPQGLTTDRHLEGHRQMVKSVGRRSRCRGCGRAGADRALCGCCVARKGGCTLPLFMDYHDELKLPQEAIDQITEEAKADKSDQFGVRQAELFHNADGKVYCLLEAPNAEAVRQHHAALGVDCGEVHEVRGIR